MPSQSGSNTANNSAKKATGKPFAKGDPRINRKGRPKSFDAMRELFQEIAHEIATKSDGTPVVISGHKATVVEAVARQWFQSKEFAKQKAALEIAFGKVPDTVQHTGEGGGPIRIIQEVVIGGAQAPGQQATREILDE